MQKRALGTTGLDIAPLVLGGNVFGWTLDGRESFRILDAFVDHGFNAIDTADSYSTWVPGNKGGESETIIGNWLKANPGKRDKVIVFTKVGSPSSLPEVSSPSSMFEEASLCSSPEVGPMTFSRSAAGSSGVAGSTAALDCSGTADSSSVLVFGTPSLARFPVRNSVSARNSSADIS